MSFKPARRLPLLLLGGALPILCGMSTPGAQTTSQPPTQRRETPQIQALVNPDGYTSARVCGQCHADIYNSWKKSLHAFSLVDPVFDTAFMQAVKEGGEKARRRCLHCHAPMTMMNNDYQLSQQVSREGVSCDFCHTVTAVHLDGRDKPYTIDLGLVKRSVLKNASSPAHQVSFSALHAKSEFCGGCHNLIGPGGVAVMSTYDEWRRSPYAAEGVQCQNCHMVLSAGRVVSEAVQESASQIHLHSLIHDSDQLRRALSVQITGTQRTVNSLQVEVLVENVGSGHMIPTGMPTREVVLQVTAESSGFSKSQERRYKKVVADAQGKPLEADYQVILRGSQILSDNRIAPREKRIERFSFPTWGTKSVKVTATLAYHYTPRLLKVQDINIQLGRDQQVVPSMRK